MIKYDYVLERHDGTKFNIFKPDQIPTELPNIAFIEGPNSTGKSTLLNIIALAFYALEKDDLHPSLRRKIERLLETADQRLTFNFEIVNEVTGEHYIANKKTADENEIDVYTVGNNKKQTRLHKTKFLKEYDLIYDIPYNPLERLKELTGDIRSKQQDLSRRITELRHAIHTIIEQIKDEMSEEAKKKLRIEYDELLGKAEVVNNELIDIRSHNSIFTNYAYILIYNLYKVNLCRLQEQLDTQKMKSHSAKRQESSLERQIKTLTERIKEIKASIRKLHIELNQVFKDYFPTYNVKLKTWEEMRLDSEIDKGSRNIVIIGKFFLNTLREEITQFEKGDAFINISLFKDLLDLLRNYEYTDAVIPGLEIKIKEFVIIVDSKYQEFKDLSIEYETMKSVADKIQLLINEYNNLLDVLVPEALELREQYIKATGEIVDISGEAQIEEMEEAKQIYNDKISTYIKMIKNLGISSDEIDSEYDKLKKEPELATYTNLSEQKLLELVEDKKAQLYNKEKEGRALSTKIQIKKRDIEILEKQEPHKYQDYKDGLKKWFRVAVALENRLLKDYHGYINELIRDKIDLRTLDPKKKYYYDQVGQYLASILKSVKHIDEEYELTKVDVINKVMTAKNGVVIKLDDFGTGQSQSAYLQGRLKGIKNKKAIVLFDEISHMDKNSLNPIYKKLKELQKEGKLILGMLVQRAEKLRVEGI